MAESPPKHTFRGLYNSLKEGRAFWKFFIGFPQIIITIPYNNNLAAQPRLESKLAPFKDICMIATRGRSPRGPHWLPGHIVLQCVGRSFQETWMPCILFPFLWAGKMNHVFLKSAQPSDSDLISCPNPEGSSRSW